jgi:hypothetical protein
MAPAAVRAKRELGSATDHARHTSPTCSSLITGPAVDLSASIRLFTAPSFGTSSAVNIPTHRHDLHVYESFWARPLS